VNLFILSTNKQKIMEGQLDEEFVAKKIIEKFD
jgi:hypothetical protein